MDNLTHTMTGVLLARAGLDRLAPRGVWIAAIAANIPDIDAVSLLGGTSIYFEYHRWATHAIVFAPAMAALAVLVVAGGFRQRLPWLRAWLIALIAISSHLLLDFTNSYGIRLLLPFSSAWLALDATHIVDLVLWAILLAGVSWPLLSGLVSSEIGAKRPKGRGVAAFALGLVAVYNTGRYLSHQRSIATLESRIYEGAAPRSVVSFPQSVSPFRWDGWVATEKAWLFIPIDLTREFDPKPAAIYWQAEPSPLIEAATQLRDFRNLLAFARTPLWRVSPVEEPEGGHRVELIDLRFGRNGGPGFRAAAVFDAQGRALRSSFHF